MSTRNNNVSRITINMPKIKHKRLKTLAALSGKSVREIVHEFIEIGISQYQELICPLNHIPNKETIMSIRDSEKEESLVKAKDAKNLFDRILKDWKTVAALPQTVLASLARLEG